MSNRGTPCLIWMLPLPVTVRAMNTVSAPAHHVDGGAADNLVGVQVDARERVEQREDSAGRDGGDQAESYRAGT